MSLSQSKKILIGCEDSSTLTTAFREAGFEAYSCDLVPTRGNPDWHFQQDVMEVVSKGWDLAVLHPSCVALSVSGNGTYAKGKPKYGERLESIEWTKKLWNLACDKCHRVALENPVSVIFQHLDYDDKFCCQPWQHGHGEVKRTCFCLRNLPRLEPSNIVEGREQRIWKMPPSETRSRDRSVTYSGVATAIVNPWGKLLESQV